MDTVMAIEENKKNWFSQTTWDEMEEKGHG
jgi:hypothetical protein